LREDDRTLVRACLDGNRRAWETLIQRYQRLLYAIPQRCGLSEDDAADVFQTVCLRLLQNLGNLRDERSLTSWLITTASREAWRVRRQRRRELAGIGTGGAGQGAWGADDAENRRSQADARGHGGEDPAALVATPLPAAA